MSMKKIFRLAELFEKRAIEEVPLTDPMIEESPEELEPPTLREYTGEEPPEVITPEERELKYQLENPINLTIEKQQLDYIIKYLARNVQRDRNTLERKYKGNVPEYETHRVRHLDNIDNIIQYINQSTNP